MRDPLFGAHVSIAGGVPTAIERARQAGIQACQIFVKNASQWKAKPLAKGEIERFRQLRQEAGIDRIVAHGTYLVNLSANTPANRERSIATLGDELDRACALELDGLVVHPGAHLGAGEEVGLQRNARSLDRVLAKRPDAMTPILLECTAGQGTVLGHRLEHLATIIEHAEHGDRLGVCIDTCHAFAAGYPLHQRDGFEEFLERFISLFGLERLGCLHLNDSRHECASRRDRHANLGAGEIGLDTFGWIVNEPRLRGIPMLLETPLGDDQGGHRRDLEKLRSLVSDRS